MMVKRTTRRTTRKTANDKEHSELLKEIAGLRELSHELRAHGQELEKDLKEARSLLYVAMGILMALFGLVLGISLRMFL